MKQEDKKIIDYYDACEGDYRLAWNLDKSLAMHAGYWDETVSSLPEALARENAILAERAGIQGGERILDAGCGVGGSSLYLAEQWECQVTGISLCPKQIEAARSHASQRNITPLPHFEVMDFTQMRFDDATFDLVLAIESICHAQDKELFLKEAFRVLKPGGRLIIADAFLTRETDDQQMTQWLEGWGGNQLVTPTAFKEMAHKAGFKNFSSEDITIHVLPSSRRLFWIAIATWPLSRVAEWFGWRTPTQTQNLSAAYHQYKTLKKGFWHYHIIQTSKPEHDAPACS